MFDLVYIGGSDCLAGESISEIFSDVCLGGNEILGDVVSWHDAIWFGVISLVTLSLIGLWLGLI